MTGWSILYFFLTLTMGVAALGASWVLWVRTGQSLVARFALLYLFLTFTVLSGLLSLYLSVHLSIESGAIFFWIDYLGSFLGRYGLTMMLPVFIHCLYEIPDESRRNRIFATIVVVLFSIQHATELVIGYDPWDAAGDILEDIALLSILLYCAFVGVKNSKQSSCSTPLALRRGIALALLIAIPGILNDTFFEDHSPWRAYPLFYGAAGWLIVGSLRSLGEETPRQTPEQFLGDHDLSRREREVAQLLLLGLTNQLIAERLFISPNTVKTHVRKIFQKLGVRNRVEFLALCHRPDHKAP